MKIWGSRRRSCGTTSSSYRARRSPGRVQDSDRRWLFAIRILSVSQCSGSQVLVQGSISNSAVSVFCVVDLGYAGFCVFGLGSVLNSRLRLLYVVGLEWPGPARRFLCTKEPGLTLAWYEQSRAGKGSENLPFDLFEQIFIAFQSATGSYETTGGSATTVVL